MTDLLLAMYSSPERVFKLADIGRLMNESNHVSLNKKVNYQVRTGRLLNPRKGIYAKPGFTWEEVACKLYTPSYISLDYVLLRAGIVFQYDSRISCISYLSREIQLDETTIIYRKIKGEIMADTRGIIKKNGINIATPERAFLDTIYLNKDYYIDNVGSLDRTKVNSLLPIYNSKKLNERVYKHFEDIY